MTLKDHARLIVEFLLGEAGVAEYQVYPDEKGWCNHLHKELNYNIQVPTEGGTFVNKISVPAPLDAEGIKQIEKRMAQLAAQRKYPTGSFFVAPWGEYLIHGGTIGKI